ncbi:MAG TPA: hypothetical protein GXX37_08380 [Clostridiaceae bacterium]|nr:hypothetical protein [Clostridiaceae bacterium]
MTNRKRIINTLNFKKPEDRLPVIEWAPLWDKTVERWKREGLPEKFEGEEIKNYLGLDSLTRIRLSPVKKTFNNYGFKVSDMDSYKRAKEHLYPDDIIKQRKESLKIIEEKQKAGETAAWLAIDGFFWFPRTLYGIEEHFYAFYDYPEVMHEINNDLCNYIISVIEELCEITVPVFMAFNEDMAYNHGPMLSKALFDEFLLPYYKRVIPVLKKFSIIPFIDCDGFIEDMIPWFIEAGIEGVLPLERKAGVDVVRIRNKYPEFKMIGAYDKMVMSKGEDEMRKEFERLLPVMKSGGFIPSCDHQTPPEVSLENYMTYIRLLKEYCIKAVN